MIDLKRVSLIKFDFTGPDVHIITVYVAKFRSLGLTKLKAPYTGSDEFSVKCLLYSALHVLAGKDM